MIPTRDGVGPSCVSLPAGPWAKLIDFVLERMPGITREEWLDRFAQGLVLDACGHPLAAQNPYTPHTRLYYYRHITHEPLLPEAARIVFEDDHLVVADKPHFMPVMPAGRYVQQSLLVQLKRLTGLDQLVPLHRIDRETAGLVLFGKHMHERAAYHALFRNKCIRKMYHAVAPFDAQRVLPPVYQSRLVPGEPFFRMQETPGPANSETHIHVIKTQGERALYALEPISGKRHQLRVHMMALGIPLEGDLFYPRVVRGPHEAEDFNQPLQLLAQHVAFTDPITAQAREWTSQLSLSITP